MIQSFAEINFQLEARLVRHVNDPKGPTVQLFRNGSPIGAPIPGALVAEGYQLEDSRILLFLTADCPYEETLYIHLLSNKFNILDSLELGGNYCTGVLEKIRCINATTLEFRFVHKKLCRLVINDKPQFMWPRWIPGVKRGVSMFRRYIDFQLISTSSTIKKNDTKAI